MTPRYPSYWWWPESIFIRLIVAAVVGWGLLLAIPAFLAVIGIALSAAMMVLIRVAIVVPLALYILRGPLV